jgi:signal transduction histidine kinase
MGKNGNLWVATAMGLNTYKDGKIKSYFKKDGLPSDRVFAVLTCRDGTIYCGTDQGLSRVENQGNQFINFKYEGGNHHNRVRTLIESHDGSLLLGTHGGLKIFDGHKISDYFEIDSLRHRPVSTVYEDAQGGIWCALLDDGILYYLPGSGMIRHLTEKEGLSSNIIYSLTMDNFGSLWAGTPHGLDKITFSSTDDLVQIRHFGTNEGFFGIEANTNAIYKEPSGEIWFGTVAGVYKCSPELDKLNTLEPITYITGIRLFSQIVDWSQLSDSTNGWFDLPVDLRLAPDQNHLTFDFFGNSLRNQEQVSYQYILENFDRHWLPVTKNNLAVYTNLPPGKYEFKVKASNKDGMWNQQAATFKFEIIPPFWSTWWFFTLAVVILVIAGRLYYNFRLQQKLKSLIHVENLKNAELVKVRRRVAEDFHDQVGNQLASITVLVQLIQAKISSGNKEVEELLSKLGQFTKTLFTGTRDFIWSIDPKSDNVNEMFIYIRDFGEELFEYSEVNFHVETNDAFDANLKLLVGWSRHVVFIFKEALTNALKHANCKNVYLNFNVSDHNFVFELKDDGVGVKGYGEGDATGMGLQNMKERARKIGGAIDITSNEDTGTVITLEGKIPHTVG